MSDYISREDVATNICYAKCGIPKGVCCKFTEPCTYVKIINNFPSADVRENIHGDWIPKERTTDCSVDIDIVCSECGYIGIETYAHGYELDELPVQEMKDYIKKFDMNYCPYCGAKMDKGDIYSLSIQTKGNFYELY